MGGGHDHAAHPLRPERVGGDQGHERGVDSPGDRHQHALEAVLLDVVAEAELQRLVHLGFGLERLREARLEPPLRARDLEPREEGGMCPRRQRAGISVVGRKPGRVVGQLQIADDEVLGELDAPPEGLAALGDDHAVAVEDELVLAADQVAEGERGTRLHGPLLDHPLALDAPAAVVRRGRGVDDDAGAGERLDRGRWPRIPDVLADRQPDPHPRDLDQRRSVPGLEVAALVEDAVVREQRLAVGGANLAGREHGDGVVRPGVLFREPDQGDDLGHVSSQPVQGAARRGQEAGPQPQVLGGVAGQRLLGEDDELRPRLPRSRDLLGDQAGVAADVTHGHVDLGEGDPQASRVVCHRTEYCRHGAGGHAHPRRWSPTIRAKGRAGSCR